MAAKNETGFSSWLREYLNNLGLDGEVYGDYIASSLLALRDSSEEERVEAVGELISGAMGDNITESTVICQIIIDNWVIYNPRKKHKQLKKPKNALTIEEHVDHIMKETIKTNPVSTDKSAIPRQPLLSAAEKKRMQQHYGYISDEEEYDTEVKDNTETVFADIFANTNKSDVTDTQRKQRSEQKMEHEAKLERDKRNRDIQLQRKDERKEKEKQRTQKQERRR